MGTVRPCQHRLVPRAVWCLRRSRRFGPDVALESVPKARHGVIQRRAGHASRPNPLGRPHPSMKRVS
jgi:hypothetical protein